MQPACQQSVSERADMSRSSTCLVEEGRDPILRLSPHASGLTFKISLLSMSRSLVGRPALADAQVMKTVEVVEVAPVFRVAIILELADRAVNLASAVVAIGLE